MYTKPHPHADLHRVRRNTLDPAHHPETFVDINQGDIVRRAFSWMGDRRGINRPETRAHPPFETVAATEGADDARVEHRFSGLGAPLVSQFTRFQVRLIERKR